MCGWLQPLIPAMKTKRKILLAAGLLFAGSVSLSAANHAVAPGQNVQAVVDGAASGDLIRFLPGVYGDLTIVNKDLTLKALGNTPAQLGALDINGSVVNLIKIGADTLRANDLPNDACKIIATQASFGNIETNATEFHIAYSTVEHLVFRGVGTVTGCEFNGEANLGGIGLDVHGAGTKIVLRNSLIKNYVRNAGNSLANECIGVQVRDGAKADVINNVIHDCKEGNGNGTNTAVGMGIYVETGSQAVMLGNVIWACWSKGTTNIGNRLIWAPATTSIVRYNLLWQSNSYTGEHSDLVGGGVSAVGTVNDNPKFVAGAPYSYQLKVSSPAINAGPPDAQYNDLDGTRNDIGMYGGHGYLPNGRTTTKPIVLSLEIEPLVVPAGGIITIQSAGAAPK